MNDEKHPPLQETPIIDLIDESQKYGVILTLYADVTNIQFWDGTKENVTDDLNITIGIDEQIAELILKHRRL